MVRSEDEGNVVEASGDGRASREKATTMPILLKKIRSQHQMTLEMLAEKSGLTKSYISKVERGLAKPSIETALKLAHAMNVSVETLFATQPSTELYSVTRAENGAAGDLGQYLSLVGGLAPNSKMRAFIVRPVPRSRRTRTLSHHSGEEILFVLRGTIELQIDKRIETLNVGDCVTLDPEKSHRLVALEDGPCEALVIINSSE